MIEFLNEIFISYGLAGLFILMFANMTILIPPSEIILPLAGFFAFTSDYSLILIIAVAVIANFIGTYVWYIVGKRIGCKPLLKIKYTDNLGNIFRNSPKFSVSAISRQSNTANKIVDVKNKTNEEIIKKIAKKFKKDHAHWVGTFRLFPLIRAVVSVPAGMVNMPKKTFAFYTLIGMTIWTMFWVFAGYLFGLSFFMYKHYVTAALLFAFAIAIAIFHQKMKKSLRGFL